MLDTCIASFSSFLLLFIGLIMYLFVIKSFFCNNNNNNNASKATNCSILDMVLRAYAISTVTSKKVMSIMGNTGEQPFFNTEVLYYIEEVSSIYYTIVTQTNKRYTLSNTYIYYDRNKFHIHK